MKQMKLLLVSITLFLSACMPIQPGMTPPATTMPAEPTTNSLVNTQWQLTSFGGPNAETPVTGDKALTLEFRPGGQVGGSGGCNSFGGKYQVQGNTLSISQIVSTMMACVTQGVMEQEHRTAGCREISGHGKLSPAGPAAAGARAAKPEPWQPQGNPQGNRTWLGLLWPPQGDTGFAQRAGDGRARAHAHAPAARHGPDHDPPR